MLIVEDALNIFRQGICTAVLSMGKCSSLPANNKILSGGVAIRVVHLI